MIFWLLVFLLVQFCAGVEDAWIVNITSQIFGSDWQPEDNLGDKNSKKFLEHQSNFCGAVSQIFTAKPVIGNPVKERFQKCFIDRFVLHVIEAPVLLSYILVFNGSEPIHKPLVDAAYIASSELYTIKDRVWTLIGDIWLTNRQNVEMTRANLSNYLVSFSENAHNTSQGDAMQDLSPEVTKNIKDMQTVMNSLDIPQVVILTKIDSICEETKHDVTNAFRSPKVEKCVAKVSEVLGLPRNAIYPMKNYEMEYQLDPAIDILALLTLKGILTNCDAHLFNHYETIRKEYAVSDRRTP